MKMSLKASEHHLSQEHVHFVVLQCCAVFCCKGAEIKCEMHGQEWGWDSLVASRLTLSCVGYRLLESPVNFLLML